MHTFVWSDRGEAGSTLQAVNCKYVEMCHTQGKISLRTGALYCIRSMGTLACWN